MPKERMNWDDLKTLLYEAADGISFEQAKGALEALIPGIIIECVDVPKGKPGYLNTYDVTIPES